MTAPDRSWPPGRAARLRRALVGCVAVVVVLTLAVGRRPGGLAVDQRILHWLVGHRGDVGVTIFRAISHLRDPLTLIVLAVVAAWVLHRRGFGADAFVPAAALVAGSITETVAKQVFGRPRPAVAYHLLRETDASFPSGHTTGTAALFMAVALVLSPSVRSRGKRIALVVGAGAIAAAVGLARMVLGVHWLTDVVAGWFLGTAWAIGIVLLVAANDVGRAGRPAQITAGADRMTRRSEGIASS